MKKINLKTVLQQVKADLIKKHEYEDTLSMEACSSYVDFFRNRTELIDAFILLIDQVPEIQKELEKRNVSW